MATYSDTQSKDNWLNEKNCQTLLTRQMRQPQKKRDTKKNELNEEETNWHILLIKENCYKVDHMAVQKPECLLQAYFFPNVVAHETAHPPSYFHHSWLKVWTSTSNYSSYIHFSPLVQRYNTTHHYNSVIVDQRTNKQTSDNVRGGSDCPFLVYRGS